MVNRITLSSLPRYKCCGRVTSHHKMFYVKNPMKNCNKKENIPPWRSATKKNLLFSRSSLRNDKKQSRKTSFCKSCGLCKLDGLLQSGRSRKTILICKFFQAVFLSTSVLCLPGPLGYRNIRIAKYANVMYFPPKSSLNSKVDFRRIWFAYSYWRRGLRTSSFNKKQIIIILNLGTIKTCNCSGCCC